MTLITALSMSVIGISWHITIQWIHIFLSNGLLMRIKRGIYIAIAMTISNIIRITSCPTMSIKNQGHWAVCIDKIACHISSKHK